MLKNPKNGPDSYFDLTAIFGYLGVPLICQRIKTTKSTHGSRTEGNKTVKTVKYSKEQPLKLLVHLIDKSAICMWLAWRNPCDGLIMKFQWQNVKGTHRAPPIMTKKPLLWNASIQNALI